MFFFFLGVVVGGGGSAVEGRWTNLGWTQRTQTFCGECFWSAAAAAAEEEESVSSDKIFFSFLETSSIFFVLVLCPVSFLLPPSFLSGGQN